MHVCYICTWTSRLTHTGGLSSDLPKLHWSLKLTTFSCKRINNLFGSHWKRQEGNCNAVHGRKKKTKKCDSKAGKSCVFNSSSGGDWSRDDRKKHQGLDNMASIGNERVQKCSDQALHATLKLNVYRKDRFESAALLDVLPLLDPIGFDPFYGRFVKCCVNVQSALF